MCEKGKPGPHHRICGSPHKAQGSDEPVVDCVCQKCGDIQTVPAFGQSSTGERPALEVPSEKEPRKETPLRKGKKGRNSQRFKDIEARKDEILAIWEKSGRKLSATAREAGLRYSTLLGKLKQWGIKTPLQELRAGRAGLPDPRLGQATIVSWPPHIPELLTKLLQIMPAPGSSPNSVARWKIAWDAAFSLVYDSGEK